MIPVIFGSSPAIALGAIPFVWVSYRIFRIGVFVDEEGVTIRDIFNTHKRVPWQEIERFDWGTRRGSNFGGIYPTDGAFVAATALEAPWEWRRGDDHAVPNALVALNDELSHHRAAPPATSVGSTPSADVEQLSLPTN